MHVRRQYRRLMSGMLCCNLTLRRRRKLTQKLLTVLLIVLLAVLVCLHFIILPSASGGYNEECYLSDEKRRTLRIMVQNISRVFDKFGVQYWLDFGESSFNNYEKTRLSGGPVVCSLNFTFQYEHFFDNGSFGPFYLEMSFPW